MFNSLCVIATLLIAVYGELNTIKPTSTTSLRWKNVSVHNIIEPTSYFLPSGHTLGILGPSGSGKSTFLRTLAGILPSSSLTSTGDVKLKQSTETRHLELADVAFLAQEDSFFSMLTVQEILDDEEQFQFKSSFRKTAEENRRKVINALGLNKLLNRRVGDRRVGGTTNQVR